MEKKQKLIELTQTVFVSLSMSDPLTIPPASCIFFWVKHLSKYQNKYDLWKTRFCLKTKLWLVLTLRAEIKSAWNVVLTLQHLKKPLMPNKTTPQASVCAPALFFLVLEWWVLCCFCCEACCVTKATLLHSDKANETLCFLWFSLFCCSCCLVFWCIYAWR